MHRRPGDRDLTACGIEPQFTGGQDGAVAAPLNASQQHPHPCGELAHRERFGHVVVGTDPQSDQHVGLTVSGGEHEDRYGTLALHFAAHLEPIGTGQHQIEHDQAGRTRRHRSMPWRPAWATSTSKPSDRRRAAIAAAIVSSSSMTAMRALDMGCSVRSPCGTGVRTK